MHLLQVSVCFECVMDSQSFSSGFFRDISDEVSVTEFLIIILSSEVKGFLYMKTSKHLLKNIFKLICAFVTSLKLREMIIILNSFCSV